MNFYYEMLNICIFPYFNRKSQQSNKQKKSLPVSPFSFLGMFLVCKITEPTSINKNKSFFWASKSWCYFRPIRVWFIFLFLFIFFFNKKLKAGGGRHQNQKCFNLYYKLFTIKHNKFTPCRE